VIEAASPIEVENDEAVCGRRVLVVEDGPTLTHGGMPYGAGWLAARRSGAEIVDPRPYAVGSIRDTYRQYPAIGPVLPAMGYGRNMIQELEQTINNADADVVIAGTPIDLARFLKTNKPVKRARYEVQEIGHPTLEEVLRARLARNR
jgi:predicted GTPase